jgi:bloom syndrome protein
MTRNNLEKHLSWLLANIAVSNPVAISFPAAHDISYLALSQSQPELAAKGHQECLPIASAIRGSAAIGPVSTSSGDDFPQSEDLFQDEEELIRVAEAMPKLTSATKPTKPALIVRQQQLLTPSSTTSKAGRFQEAYKARLQLQGPEHPSPHRGNR